jgi:hypothetical protein
VQVNGGATLTVGNAAAFSNSAAVTVATGGALTLAAAKPVANLDLSGTLGGDTFALTASGGITLRAGALVQTPIGGGALTVAAGGGSATLQRKTAGLTEWAGHVAPLEPCQRRHRFSSEASARAAMAGAAA